LYAFYGARVPEEILGEEFNSTKAQTEYRALLEN
jgi:hypothetical protein